MWRIALKGMLAHKLRLVLTSLAIVLGITFVSGTLILTDTLHSTFTTLFNTVYQNVDFEIRGTAAFNQQSGGAAIRKPFSDSLLSSVRQVPGVQYVDGAVGGYAQYIAKDGRAIVTTGAPTFGLTFAQQRQLSSLKLVAGTAPHGATQVAMDQGTALKYGFHVGDHVKIVLPDASRTFTISGIVRFGTVNNLAGATLAAFDLPTSQRLFDKVGQLDTIDVALAPGSDRSVVEHAINALLPPGVEVVSGQTVANENSNSINQALGFFSTALLVFALVAVFVGAFTIFNTFSIIVGQRTKELALLRIVGASRRQVFLSVILEAMLLGIGASVVGIGLGVLTAKGLDSLLRAFGISMPQSPLIFRWRTVAVALGVGVGVTVASSLGPARHAVRIPPIAAMSDFRRDHVTSVRRRLVLGLLVAVVGIAAVLSGLGRQAIQLVGVGAVATFVGVGMLAPLIARPISSVLGRPFTALGGASGNLGRQNSMRNPRRLAQTASALTVGLALVSTFSVFGASISQSATASIKDAILADYIITGSSSASAASGISTSVRADVARIRGVTSVSTVEGGQFQIERSVRTIAAISPADLSRTVRLRITSGSGVTALAGGEMLIDTTTANKAHLAVGESIGVVFAETGATSIRIGGTYKPNSVVGSYVVSDAYFGSHFAKNPLPVAVLVNATRGADAATTSAIKAGLSAFPNLKIQSRAEFIAAQQAQVNQLTGIVYALLMLAILIALIGIVNTLVLSVFERTREIGLLRAVGMRRRQVRAMIRTEAVILALFGALIGVATGTGLGIALSLSLRDQGITDVVVPYGTLAMFFLFAGILGLTAAVWPARRAARLNILDAIAVE